MAGQWSTSLLLICVCLNFVEVLMIYGEDSSGSICSNEFEVQSYVARLASQCFNISLPSDYSRWRLCADTDEEDFTCHNLKRYVSIIPSCTQCELLYGLNKQKCYRDQLAATDCTINKMVIPTVVRSFTCLKEKGQCVREKTSPHLIDSLLPVTPAAAPVNDDSTTRSNDITGVEEHYWKKEKCPSCPECDSCEEGQTGNVSIVGGVGLFFLGLILGALVSCCICVFVPKLQRNSSNNLQHKVLKTCNCLGPNQSESQNSNGIPGTGSTNGAVTNPSPDTYNDLTGVSATDCHTYAETSAYTDPRMSATYNDPQDNVRQRQPSSVNSPTYHIPHDDIFTGTTNGVSGASAKQPSAPSLSTDYNYDYADQSLTDSNRETNEYNSLVHNNHRTSHEYNSLKHAGQQQNEEINENERDSSLPDHQYFVLEQQNGGNHRPAAQTPNTTNTVDHSYFVLEKQNK